MKTSELLNLDCRKDKNNINILTRFLWKIKPVQSIVGKCVEAGGDIDCVYLEDVLHKVCSRYEYKLQQIWVYEEEHNFVMYSVGILRKQGSEWIGDVTAVSFWELVAKCIIKIYSDVKGRKKNEK